MDLNCQFPINSLSYGNVGTNLAVELHKLGHRISLWPIGSCEIQDESVLPIIQEQVNNQGSYNYKAPSIRLYHQFSLAERVGIGTHFGFPIFETTRFSDREKCHLLGCDRLIVCSEWAQKIVAEQLSGKRSFVVPLGIDRNIFNENVGIVSRKPFIIQHWGKAEFRKGLKEIIRIFNLAFNISDDVELQLYISNPFLSEKEWNQWLSELNQNNKLYRKTIIHIERFKSQKEVARKMSEASVGLFPSRAEGWGLESLEMMGLGKDIILTNYSGHTAYATKENSHLIDIEELETAYDSKWFNGKVGEWAKLGDNQIDQAVTYLRGLYDGSIKSKREKAIETSKQFSWENSAKELIKVVC